MPKARRGRASIFRDKEDGKNVHGIITKAGARRFEDRRKDLSELYQQVHGQRPTTVSDADVIEFMARGYDNTRDYLEKNL